MPPPVKNVKGSRFSWPPLLESNPERPPNRCLAQGCRSPAAPEAAGRGWSDAVGPAALRLETSWVRISPHWGSPPLTSMVVSERKNGGEIVKSPLRSR